MKILPRLSKAQVNQLCAYLAERNESCEQLAEMAWRQFDLTPQYHSAGGIRPEPDELEQLRNDILNTARTCGFPQEAGANFADFDRAACRIIHNSDLLRACYEGELWRDDTWAGLTCLYLLDIALWRYGPQTARLGGGNRNVFQRLWIRTRVLLLEDEPNPWVLIDSLTEDAFVQLVERTGLLSHPKLTQTIARCWLAMKDVAPAGQMETLMRIATTRIRAMNELYGLELLDPEDLADEVDSTFRSILTEMSKPDLLQ